VGKLSVTNVNTVFVIQTWKRRRCPEGNPGGDGMGSHPASLAIG